METNHYNRIGLIIPLLLFIIFILNTVYAVERNKMTSAPKDFAIALYKEDSIQITSKSKELAESFIKKKIKKNKSVKGKIVMTWYDDSLSSYLVEYKYIDTCKILTKRNSGKILVYENDLNCRYVWVKFLFESNNGDYIITPKIIKTARPKEPYYEDHVQIEFEPIN